MSTEEALAVGSGAEIESANYQIVQRISGADIPDFSSTTPDAPDSFGAALVKGTGKETTIIYNSVEVQRDRLRNEIRRLLDS